MGKPNFKIWMKIIVVVQSGWVCRLDNSVAHCCLFVLLAASPAAARPRRACMKLCPTTIIYVILRNWTCRYDARIRRATQDGVLEVVLLTSDSTDATEGGERRKSVAYCQCGGKRKGPRIVSEVTGNRAEQVLEQVHGLLRSY